MEVVLTDYFIQVGIGKLILLVVSFLVLFIINVIMIKKVIKNDDK